MKDFSLKITQSTEPVIIEISGPFDANSAMPDIAERKIVILRLGDVTMMSSFGIKVWCYWSKNHRQLPVIFLENCAYVFAKNFSSIYGFLGPNMQVRSFYVPFYNDESHETKNYLMVAGQDFDETGVFRLPSLVDSRGAPMEIDVDAKSYFEFLKNNG